MATTNIDSKRFLYLRVGQKTGQWLTPNFYEAWKSMSSFTAEAETPAFASLLFSPSGLLGPLLKQRSFYYVCFDAAFLSNTLTSLLRSVSDNDFSTSVLPLLRSELSAKETHCSYMNLKGRYILTTDVCHLFTNRKSNWSFMN